jgi:Ca2+-binding EF-hand superfamily protein
LNIVQASSHAEDMDFGAFLEVFGFSGDGQSEASLGQLFEYFDVNKQGAFGP